MGMAWGRVAQAVVQRVVWWQKVVGAVCAAVQCVKGSAGRAVAGRWWWNIWWKAGRRYARRQWGGGMLVEAAKARHTGRHRRRIWRTIEQQVGGSSERVHAYRKRPMLRRAQEDSGMPGGRRWQR